MRQNQEGEDRHIRLCKKKPQTTALVKAKLRRKLQALRTMQKKSSRKHTLPSLLGFSLEEAKNTSRLEPIAEAHVHTSSEQPLQQLPVGQVRPEASPDTENARLAQTERQRYPLRGTKTRCDEQSACHVDLRPSMLHSFVCASRGKEHLQDLIRWVCTQSSARSLQPACKLPRFATLSKKPLRNCDLCLLRQPQP